MSKDKSKAPKDQIPADPNKGGGEPNLDEGNRYVRGRVEVHLPPSLVEKYETAQEESHTRDKKRFIVESLTLFFVIVVAGLTLWQNLLTRDQFHIDQRPQIWKANNQAPLIVVRPGERVFVNIYWANYGKSPVLRFSVLGKVFVGEDAMVQAEAWFRANPVVAEERTIVIPPGPPGEAAGAEFISLHSDNIVDQTLVNWILSHDFSIVAVTRAQYYDRYGVRYWTDLCISRHANGSIPNCPNNNNDMQ